MRRRLYFALPDVASAQQTMNALLLSRVEESHIHCLARRDAPLGNLHEANVLQKTDIVHGAELGLILGGAGGTAVGILMVFAPPEGVSLQLVTVLIAALIGAVPGAWVSSLVASAVPNSRLSKFAKDIEEGKILMMVDVPARKVEQIRALVEKRHPEAAPGGMEPTIPAFP
ncbi:MAG TPA: DUF1269 domain-containing protein [Burkholderiales bacterium]|nr:DUF1269 domain-containing protein [Burkholderiales bacterium]